MFGSVPLRAVLPDGDIDISVFAVAEGSGSHSSSGGSSSTAGGTSSEQDGGGSAAGSAPPPPPAAPLRDSWASQLLRALEREAARPDAAFKIRDVQIIQAEVRLVQWLLLAGRLKRTQAVVAGCHQPLPCPYSVLQAFTKGSLPRCNLRIAICSQPARPSPLSLSPDALLARPQIGLVCSVPLAAGQAGQVRGGRRGGGRVV